MYFNEFFNIGKKIPDSAQDVQNMTIQQLSDVFNDIRLLNVNNISFSNSDIDDVSRFAKTLSKLIHMLHTLYGRDGTMIILCGMSLQYNASLDVVKNIIKAFNGHFLQILADMKQQELQKQNHVLQDVEHSLEEVCKVVSIADQLLCMDARFSEMLNAPTINYGSCSSDIKVIIQHLGDAIDKIKLDGDSGDRLINLCANLLLVDFQSVEKDCINAESISQKKKRASYAFDGEKLKKSAAALMKKIYLIGCNKDFYYNCYEVLDFAEKSKSEGAAEYLVKFAQDLSSMSRQNNKKTLDCLDILLSDNMESLWSTFSSGFNRDKSAVWLFSYLLYTYFPVALEKYKYYSSKYCSNTYNNFYYCADSSFGFSKYLSSSKYKLQNFYKILDCLFLSDLSQKDNNEIQEILNLIQEKFFNSNSAKSDYSNEFIAYVSNMPYFARGGNVFVRFAKCCFGGNFLNFDKQNVPNRYDVSKARLIASFIKQNINKDNFLNKIDNNKKAFYDVANNVMQSLKAKEYSKAIEGINSFVEMFSMFALCCLVSNDRKTIKNCNLQFDVCELFTVLSELDNENIDDGDRKKLYSACYTFAELMVGSGDCKNLLTSLDISNKWLFSLDLPGVKNLRNFNFRALRKQIDKFAYKNKKNILFNREEQKFKRQAIYNTEYYALTYNIEHAGSNLAKSYCIQRVIGDDDGDNVNLFNIVRVIEGIEDEKIAKIASSFLDGEFVGNIEKIMIVPCDHSADLFFNKASDILKLWSGVTDICKKHTPNFLKKVIDIARDADKRFEKLLKNIIIATKNKDHDKIKLYLLQFKKDVSCVIFANNILRSKRNNKGIFHYHTNKKYANDIARITGMLESFCGYLKKSGDFAETFDLRELFAYFKKLTNFSFSAERFFRACGFEKSVGVDYVININDKGKEERAGVDFANVGGKAPALADVGKFNVLFDNFLQVVTYSAYDFKYKKSKKLFEKLIDFINNSGDCKIAFNAQLDKYLCDNFDSIFKYVGLTSFVLDPRNKVTGCFFWGDVLANLKGRTPRFFNKILYKANSVNNKVGGLLDSIEKELGSVNTYNLRGCLEEFNEKMKFVVVANLGAKSLNLNKKFEYHSSKALRLKLQSVVNKMIAVFGVKKNQFSLSAYDRLSIPLQNFFNVLGVTAESVGVLEKLGFNKGCLKIKFGSKAIENIFSNSKPAGLVKYLDQKKRYSRHTKKVIVNFFGLGVDPNGRVFVKSVRQFCFAILQIFVLLGLVRMILYYADAAKKDNAHEPIEGGEQALDEIGAAINKNKEKDFVENNGAESELAYNDLPDDADKKIVQNKTNFKNSKNDTEKAIEEVDDEEGVVDGSDLFQFGLEDDDLEEDDNYKKSLLGKNDDFEEGVVFDEVDSNAQNDNSDNGYYSLDECEFGNDVKMNKKNKPTGIVEDDIVFSKVVDSDFIKI